MENMSKNELVHGGQLNKMVQRYGIPLEQWLDLSTGIAPTSFPIPTIPQNVWKQLPQPSEALLSAANDYYQTENLLPIAGSQAVIQILPKIAAKQGYAVSRVWVPKVGYQEHRKAWQEAGYGIMFYQDISEIATMQQQDIVVLINPNNPSGVTYSYTQVEWLFSQIKQQAGLLIIDEAFMDSTPQHSFIAKTHDPAAIVLRSVGKFYGLAGIRLGFVSAHQIWLDGFSQQLGPWSINGPAQYIGQRALADKAWQNQQRTFLKAQSLQLAGLLHTTFNQAPTGTFLFQTVRCEQAPLVFEKLCQQGIYVRLCDEQNALRFGIPDENGLTRLKQVLPMLFCYP